jgi:hypothetical protein
LLKTRVLIFFLIFQLKDLKRGRLGDQALGATMLLGFDTLFLIHRRIDQGLRHAELAIDASSGLSASILCFYKARSLAMSQRKPWYHLHLLGTSFMTQRLNNALMKTFRRANTVLCNLE